MAVFAAQAIALPAYMDAAATAYKYKPGGSLSGKGCNLCHAGQTNQNSLNFYGKDVQTALKSGPSTTVTPELLRTLDSKDSDGDGWPNVMEFQADTLPGDPLSKPPGTPPVAPGAKPAPTGSAGASLFSLQAIFYPSHAQHPIIVHFPIALFIFSLLLDFLALRSRSRAFTAAAYYNLIGAAIGAIASVISGLLAWRFRFDMEPLSSDPNLLYHLILGVVSTVLLCSLWAIRAKTQAKDTQPVSRLYLSLALTTFAVISVTGHFGGILSGIVK